MDTKYFIFTFMLFNNAASISHLLTIQVSSVVIVVFVRFVSFLQVSFVCAKSGGITFCSLSFFRCLKHFIVIFAEHRGLFLEVESQ